MTYSVFVIVALTIHVLTNVNMFIKKDHIPAIWSYRAFLISIVLFYTTDILWGIFQENALGTALYIDTILYFVTVGSTVLLWTRFITKYLEGCSKVFSIIIRAVGIAFFLGEISIIIVNFFTPIMFEVDSSAKYIANTGRYVMLIFQVAMYGIIALFSAFYVLRRKVELQRRYVAILAFDIIMMVCIFFQIIDTTIPFYSMGLLIGISVLNVLTLTDTKESLKTEYLHEIEVKEEKEHELEHVITIAYKDALTGVKSRYAYVQRQELIDKEIANHTIKEFALIVFDINGLKRINDEFGHDVGDKYIIECVELMKQFFPEESLYRFGGDEFVSIIEGKDIDDIETKHEEFFELIKRNAKEFKPIVSSGMSKFRADTDYAFKTVFNRADKMMYSRKDYLKEHNR